MNDAPDSIDVALPELSNADTDAYLKCCFDAAQGMDASPEALRACYVLSYEKLNVPGLVADVEQHIRIQGTSLFQMNNRSLSSIAYAVIP